MPGVRVLEIQGIRAVVWWDGVRMGRVLGMLQTLRC